jgi:DNA helicase-2/ATP-dependent DNA helicase PcrA
MIEIEQSVIKHKPSKYQEAIYDAILHTDKNIVIRASAGSGKTSTIIEASKLIPSDKCCLFLAFNKSIVEELSSRLPPQVVCSTLHSLGMRATMSHFRTNFRVNEYKSFNFMDELLKAKPEIERRDPKEIMGWKFALRQAVDLCRMTMTDLTEEALFNMCCYYSIDLLQHEILDIIFIVKRIEIYNRAFSKKYNQLDYVDMIHVPITNWKIKMPQYDYVFVDELQDLSMFQQILIERLLLPKGRTIAVGDPNQSIYNFAGADINSFKRFTDRPNTITLPLSISYRCPTEIVKLAQKVYSDIEPCETNDPGEIRYGSHNEIEEGDMVLCRNNRPLTYLYFLLLQQGKNPIIIGKDIQIGLEALISKYLKKSTTEGVELIKDRLKKCAEELKGRGVKNIKEHPKYVALYDKVMTIEIIANRFETMKQVSDAITTMFSIKENCIKLMSIHKSKGLESNRVFYIERFDGKRLLPSPYAIQEWEKIQETNLKFVMLTRSKKSLIFIQNLES